MRGSCLKIIGLQELRCIQTCKHHVNSRAIKIALHLCFSTKDPMS